MSSTEATAPATEIPKAEAVEQKVEEAVKPTQESSKVDEVKEKAADAAEDVKDKVADKVPEEPKADESAEKVEEKTVSFFLNLLYSRLSILSPDSQEGKASIFAQQALCPHQPAHQVFQEGECQG